MIISIMLALMPMCSSEDEVKRNKALKHLDELILASC